MIPPELNWLAIDHLQHLGKEEETRGFLKYMFLILQKV
jgi:hypothetical protein